MEGPAQSRQRLVIERIPIPRLQTAVDFGQLLTGLFDEGSMRSGSTSSEIAFAIDAGSAAGDGGGIEKHRSIDAAFLYRLGTGSDRHGRWADPTPPGSLSRADSLA
jgi:hypothetical protein